MEEAERLCDELVIMDHGRILDQGAPRELIRRHCEREVVEVRTGGERARARLAECDGRRLEEVGDTLYAYADDARPLVARLEGEAGMIFLHRPASLEDVFLRLTGRELRD